MEKKTKNQILNKKKMIKKYFQKCLVDWDSSVLFLLDAVCTLSLVSQRQASAQESL